MTNKQCPQCGLLTGINRVCHDCNKENQETWWQIVGLMRLGHTDHCAKRQVWGDGECECLGTITVKVVTCNKCKHVFRSARQDDSRIRCPQCGSNESLSIRPQEVPRNPKPKRHQGIIIDDNVVRTIPLQHLDESKVLKNN